MGVLGSRGPWSRGVGITAPASCSDRPSGGARLESCAAQHEGGCCRRETKAASWFLKSQGLARKKKLSDFQAYAKGFDTNTNISAFVQVK